MNEVDIQQLYNEQVQDDLIRRTREAVSNLIELCPHEFGLENLIPCDASFRSTVPERLAQLYQEVCEYCTEASIPFDHAWVSIPRKHHHHVLMSFIALGIGMASTTFL